MSIRRLVTFLTFLAIFAMAARISVDTDTWWHLRAGQWILENQAIPRVDSFSYTRVGEAWIYPGWLVEVPMYLIYKNFGAGGLNIWTAGMVCLTFIFLWSALVGGVFLRAFVLIISATSAGVYWSARPHLVTLLFAAIFIWILEDCRWRDSVNARRRLWWLPLLMILWVNSHGGFIIGFLLWGVYFIDAIIRWKIGILTTSNFKLLLLIGCLMIFGMGINPGGMSMLAYPFKTVQLRTLQGYIQEWQSPNFHDLAVQPFAWLIVVTLGIVGASHRRIALTDFLLYGGFVYMGLMAGRNIALFSLVAPLVIARHAEPLINELSTRLKIQLTISESSSQLNLVINWFILVIFGIIVFLKIIFVVPVSINQREFNKTLPVAATEYLKNHKPPGRLFNSYNWGGYLLYNLPDYPVFVDGRTDLYNDLIINEWLKVVQAREGWQEILDRWQINLILLEPDQPIISNLVRTGWKLLLKDGVAVLLQRPYD